MALASPEHPIADHFPLFFFFFSLSFTGLKLCARSTPIARITRFRSKFRQHIQEKWGIECKEPRRMERKQDHTLFHHITNPHLKPQRSCTLICKQMSVCITVVVPLGHYQHVYHDSTMTPRPSTPFPPHHYSSFAPTVFLHDHTSSWY